MTGIGLDGIILAPLLVHLGLLVLLALAYHLRARRRRPPRAKDHLYRCQVCGCVYPEKRNLPLARCPACTAMNEVLRTSA